MLRKLLWCGNAFFLIGVGFLIMGIVQITSEIKMASFYVKQSDGLVMIIIGLSLVVFSFMKRLERKAGKNSSCSF